MNRRVLARCRWQLLSLAMSSERDLATSFLNRICNGETTISADLFPLVYEQLRAIASSLLLQERADHTLQPTALVHEAYLRLVDLKNVDSDDSENVHAHFVAISARAMRRIMVEHARSRGRIKRGGIRQRITIDESLQGLPAQSTSFIDLEDALKKLEAIDPRLVRAA